VFLGEEGTSYSLDRTLLLWNISFKSVARTDACDANSRSYCVLYQQRKFLLWEMLCNNNNNNNNNGTTIYKVP